MLMNSMAQVSRTIDVSRPLESGLPLALMGKPTEFGVRSRYELEIGVQMNGRWQ